MDLRKSGAGADLPIALAFLAATEQISPQMRELLETHVVYGELSLSGEIHAPADLSQALRVARMPMLTGRPASELREGEWSEIKMLNQPAAERRMKTFDWESFWEKPSLPSFTLHEKAARQLMLASHMRLNTLLAGPQGTGKTTWAKLLHALTTKPLPADLYAREAHFGEEAYTCRWRPFEQPHHSATPQAMIGGGNPVVPGIITRAHGGVLVMDEFLQFHPVVLEALREPVESGHVDIARRGSRERFPARFQLVATTNLCPCGKLNPLTVGRNCTLSLGRCRSTTARLSGPLLDRFDFLSLTHEWTGRGARMAVEEIAKRIEAAGEFARTRPAAVEEPPAWIGELELNHRRRRSMALVARGLADLDAEPKVLSRHTQEAFELVVTPMKKLREIFG
jgi:magnesium chelatase family protein